MSDTPSQLPLTFEAKRSYARADFVPGENNAAALAFVDAWPAWPARVCALSGPKGSGKTHLAQIWRGRAEASDVVPSAVDDAFVAALVPGAALLVDDADSIADEKAFFHLINFINQSDGWLLLTGTTAPTLWRTQVPDLHSRLAAVPCVELQAPDEALIARVLLKLFADRQLKLPEAVIDYLVPRLRRSFSDAEGIVAAIDTLALQKRRNVSIEIASQALRLLEAQRSD